MTQSSSERCRDAQADQQATREAAARSKFAQQALAGLQHKLAGGVTAGDSQQRSVAEQA